MITRIIFVWFIKQKNLVPGNLFDENFIETILKDFDSKAQYLVLITMQYFRIFSSLRSIEPLKMRMVKNAALQKASDIQM